MSVQIPDNACPICRTSDVKLSHDARDVRSYMCRRCGKFGLTGSADAMIRSNNRGNRGATNASAWIYENQGVELGSNEIDALWENRAPTVAERAMKLLREIERRYPQIGTPFSFQFPNIIDSDPSWLAVSWSSHAREVAYLLIDYLHHERGAVKGSVQNTLELSFLVDAQITPAGYKILEELNAGNPHSPTGFCAMWFKNEMLPLWSDGIEPAIRDAGYEPLRIDRHEHTNRIDDEIIALIRRSRFVVADFSGQRGGVYFEAGFALGLGLRVIWTCQEDDLKDVHFDTRQYNFLTWKPGEYVDLKKKLQNRIEATLSRGPLLVRGALPTSRSLLS